MTALKRRRIHDPAVIETVLELRRSMHNLSEIGEHLRMSRPDVVAILKECMDPDEHRAIGSALHSAAALGVQARRRGKAKARFDQMFRTAFCDRWGPDACDANG